MFRPLSLLNLSVRHSRTLKLGSQLKWVKSSSLICPLVVNREFSFFAPNRSGLSLTDKLKIKWANYRNGNRNSDAVRAGAVASAGFVLFGKMKYLLVALKLTKLAPAASMLVSIGAYSMFFGLPYACGMVGLIFVHELGHCFAMKHYNVPFSPMVFVPFFGAAIGMSVSRLR